MQHGSVELLNGQLNCGVVDLLPSILWGDSHSGTINNTLWLIIEALSYVVSALSMTK